MTSSDFLDDSLCYRVFTGVYCLQNPGPQAIAMITLLGLRRDEWSKRLPGEINTPPKAWVEIVTRALHRVHRPHQLVVIYVRDLTMCQSLSKPGYSTERLEGLARKLRDRPNTSVQWIGKTNSHPEMERAHNLAQRTFNRFRG